MKKIFFYIVAITCTLTVTAQNGCNTGAPGWGRSLGKVNFKSTKTWKIGKREWSDVVTAANCQKTAYAGGSAGYYSADCRQNVAGGDLFSWCAIVRFKDQICPKGWRVPTKEDFITLGMDLMDSSEKSEKKGTNPIKKYALWGCLFEGHCCNAQGEIIDQGSYAYYWSRSEFSSDYGIHLSFNISDDIYPQSNSNKGYGFTLRCIK